MKKRLTAIFVSLTLLCFISIGVAFANPGENKLGIKVWDDKTGGVGIAVKNDEKRRLGFFFKNRSSVIENISRSKPSRIKENSSFRWATIIAPSSDRWSYGYDDGGDFTLIPAGSIEKIADSVSQTYSVTAERPEAQAWTFAALGIRNMSLENGEFYKIHFVAQDQNGKVYVCDKTAEGKMFVYAKFPEDFGWLYLKYSGRIEITAYIDNVEVKSMVANYSKNRTVIYE